MSAPRIRVTGGEYRGRHLDGAATGTRPATALVRAAIFNRPDVLARVGGRVLDLYAGAGLLGVEALSRGAAAVDFVERSREACAVIRRNVTVVEGQERSQVFCRPVERALPRLQPPYDLCFADPPYDLDATPTLERLAQAVVVGEGGLLLWRHPARHPAPERLGPLARSERRRYGDGVVETYAWEPLS